MAIENFTFTEGDIFPFTIGTHEGVNGFYNWSTSANSAQFDSDFVVNYASAENYTLKPNQQFQIMFTLVDDDIVEPDETFSFHIDGQGVPTNPNNSATSFSRDIVFTIKDNDVACFIDLNSDGIEGPVELTYDQLHKAIARLGPKVTNYRDQIHLAHQIQDLQQNELASTNQMLALGIAETICTIGSLGVSNAAETLGKDIPKLVKALAAAKDTLFADTDSVISLINATVSIAELFGKSYPVASVVLGTWDSVNKLKDATDQIHALNQRMAQTDSDLAFTIEKYNAAKADLDKLALCAHASKEMSTAEATVLDTVRSMNGILTETVISQFGLTLNSGTAGDDIAQVHPGTTKLLVVDLQEGNDVLNVDMSDHVDTLLVVAGGDGLDLVVLNDNSQHYAWARSADGAVAATDLDSTDRTQLLFTDVERLGFSDGRVAFDLDGTNGAGAAYRIYQAAFDRTPDIGGLTYWTEQADKSMSTIEMAARFIDSDEFRHLYGSSNPAADQFIQLIYENVLHRSPDAGGHDYWAGQLAGGMSEAEMLARFADSAENRADVVGIISNGIWLNPEGDYAS